MGTGVIAVIWVGVLLTLLAVGGIIYWLVIVSEGAYLSDKIVGALYEGNAAKYDAIKGVLAYEDGTHLARPLLAALNRAATLHPGQMHHGGEYRSRSTESADSPRLKDGEACPLVLDVATGTGRLPAALLRQLDFHGYIVGLDASPRMLAAARSKIQAHSHKVAWIRKDAMTLPFRDTSFDAVTCVEALELLPDPGGALKEMIRVLRPGGQLLLSNRVGVDALFLPGRAFRPPVLEKKLKALGLTDVRTRRWQSHYDLIDARKPSLNIGGTYGAASS